VFNVEADGGQRRVSRVALEGDRVLILTLPGKALSSLGSLSVNYQPLDLSLGAGYLANSDSSPISSLSVAVTAFTTSVTLVGNSATNVLDEREGADQLVGANGDDLYIVDDEVVELLDEGVDTVFSMVSYALPANVERIVLSGWEGLSAFGNELNNIIQGNNGPNLLDGGLGEDLLIGGRGNDSCYINSAADRIVESGLESDHDVVLASVSWVLGSKLEELRLQGVQTIDGIGNERNNLIFGNSSSNMLDGGPGGVDQLTGLEGSDVFRFSTRPAKMTKTYADRITDFTVSQGDTIALRRSAFNISPSSQVSLASVKGDDYVIASSATGALFVYDRLDGALYWNENGSASGFGAGGVVAILNSIPELSSAVIKLY